MQISPDRAVRAMACVFCHIDPVPVFELEVNPLSKSFNVTLDASDKPVYVSSCYRNGHRCSGIPSSRKDVGTTAGQTPSLHFFLKKAHFLKNVCDMYMQIIPSQSQSAVIHFPFLLPCVCVEVVPFLFHWISVRLPCHLSGISMSFPGVLPGGRFPSWYSVPVFELQFCRWVWLYWHCLFLHYYFVVDCRGCVLWAKKGPIWEYGRLQQMMPRGWNYKKWEVTDISSHNLISHQESPRLGCFKVTVFIRERNFYHQWN